MIQIVLLVKANVLICLWLGFLELVVQNEKVLQISHSLDSFMFYFVLFWYFVVPYRNVMTALQFPKIMEFLPVLLPRHFKWLIESGSKEMLKEIEEILGTHPWKLGFSKVSKTFAQHIVILCKAWFQSWQFFLSLSKEKNLCGPQYWFIFIQMLQLYINFLWL